jgi:hypothetical protein
MSPRSSELGLPRLLSSKRVCPSPGNKWKGGHTRLRVRGWGSPNCDDWRKSLAFCLLCIVNSPAVDLVLIEAKLGLLFTLANVMVGVSSRCQKRAVKVMKKGCT